MNIDPRTWSRKAQIGGGIAAALIVAGAAGVGGSATDETAEPVETAPTVETTEPVEIEPAYVGQPVVGAAVMSAMVAPANLLDLDDAEFAGLCEAVETDAQFRRTALDTWRAAPNSDLLDRFDIEDVSGPDLMAWHETACG